MFGLTGYPITAIAEEAINLGIRFVGFRNEACSKVSLVMLADGLVFSKPPHMQHLPTDT